MNLDKAREAFTHDPQYHTLVELLVQQIETLQMTPSEVREVAMFACIIVEERRKWPTMIYTPELYKKFVLGEWDVFEQKDESTFPVCQECHVAIGPGSGGLCNKCRVAAAADACQEIKEKTNGNDQNESSEATEATGSGGERISDSAD